MLKGEVRSCEQSEFVKHKLLSLNSVACSYSLVLVSLVNRCIRSLCDQFSFVFCYT